MAIFGQKDALSPAHLDEMNEYAGLRGYGGEFERSIFVRAAGLTATPDQTKRLHRRFLESARVQQQLIDSRARYWAPIQFTGAGPKGPYIILEHFPRTAEQLIQRKVKLSRLALYRIVRAVVKGLREIKELRGRPHGNLKPTNILIAGDLDARRPRILLCDPAPSEDLVRQTQGTNDLYELGQLIHQLVLHVPFTGAWPIPAGPQWSRLGNGDTSWRGLVNQLLHPNPEKRLSRLTHAARRVAALNPRKLRLRSPAGITAILITAIAAGAWVNSQYFPNTPSTPSGLAHANQPRPTAPAPARTTPERGPVTLTDISPAPSTPPAPATRQAIAHLPLTRPSPDTEALAAKAKQEQFAREEADRQRLAREKAAREAALQQQRQREEMAQQEAARKAAEEQKKNLERFATTLTNTKISDHAPLQTQWQQWTKQLVTDLQSDPARLTPELEKQVEQQRKRFAAADEALRSLPAGIELPQTSPTLSNLLEALTAEHESRRKTLEQQIIASTRASSASAEPGDVAPRDTIAAHNQWSAAARQFLLDLDQIVQHLNAGRTPDEKPAPDAPSVTELLPKIRNHPLAAEPRIAPLLDSILSPITAAASSEWQTLLRIAASDQNPLGLRLSAWQTLGAQANLPWPAGQADLRLSLSIAENLNAVLQRQVSDTDRQDRWRLALQSHAQNHWSRFIQSAATPADIQFALDIRQQVLGGTDVPLDPRGRFNVALHALKQSIGSDSPADRARVYENAAALRSAADALPEANRTHAGMSLLLGAVREWTEPSALPIDFTKLGPAGAAADRALAGSSLRWSARHEPATDSVTYTAPLPPEISREELTLTFRRVGGQSAGLPAAYVCTTEVSFGLFHDLVSAAGKWPRIAELLWRYDPADGDPRPGPRIWEWPRYGSLNRGMKRTIYWLSGNAAHYPIELATRENRMVLRDPDGRASRELNPAKRHPMQYVSPVAAVAFAELLGCRLLTPHEWKAAYAMQTSRADAASRSPANLRDRTWGMQYRWAYATRGSERYGPDLGTFMPPGEERTSELWASAQSPQNSTLSTPQPPQPYDDAILWFNLVGDETSPAFSHLIGNVSELVHDGEKLFIIGGSALSPPAPVRPVDEPREVADWQKAPGWSDVGFRLAFSAPVASIEKLRFAAAGVEYIPAR